MKHYHFIILLSFFVSCSFIEKEESLSVAENFHNVEISAASGIEYFNNEYYLISDNQSFLFHSENLESINVIDIFKNNSQSKEIKSEKLDFEGLAVFNHHENDFLLIISSGSVLNYRDTAVLYNLSFDSVDTKMSFRPLYDLFLDKSEMDQEYLNIEGVTSTTDSVYFVQRGNINGANIVYSLGKFDLMNFMNSGLVPKLSNISIRLINIEPEYDVLPGLSGITTVNDSLLLFSASMEDTYDTYNDGEVLGSLLGLLNLKTNEIKTRYLLERDHLIRTKVESLTIIEENNSTYMIMCCSDNDDGVSEFNLLKLNFNE